MNKKRAWTLLISYFVLFIIGWVFYFLGLFAAAESAAEDDLDSALGGMVLLLIGGAFIMAGFALFLTWYATQNRDMNQITGGQFNTTLWTILLVVPIAQFVSLYKLADHIHKAHSTVGLTGLHPVVMFLLMFLVPIVGHVIAQLQMDKLGG